MPLLAYKPQTSTQQLCQGTHHFLPELMLIGNFIHAFLFVFVLIFSLIARLLYWKLYKHEA